MTGGRRGWGAALLLAAAAFIGYATLRPVRGPLIPMPFWCLACGDLGGVDVVLNVALFVPLGVALALFGVPWRRTLLLSLGVSMLIEGLQFAVIPGRDSSLSDLLTNALGGALGALIASRWREWCAPSARGGRRLSIGATVGAIAVLAATAALLRPTMPIGFLFGQWAPQRLSFEPYSGHVAVFTVNGFPIRYGMVDRWDSVGALIRRREAVAQLEFLSGAPPTRLSAIARLVGHQQEFFLLGARGDAFVFRQRLAVRDWRLRTPLVAIPGALPVRGENVRAQAALRDDGWHVRLETPRGAIERAVPFWVALG
ncbi:MAG TPA: VanZ family protein [Gemmatimonadaceae bacterium]|nr:VanZ family protein [Gemmatimonadaceae bacterium]